MDDQAGPDADLHGRGLRRGRVLLHPWQTFLLAVALLLAGAARGWEAFDHNALLTWAYLAGLAGGAFALVALYRFTERSARDVTR